MPGLPEQNLDRLTRMVANYSTALLEVGDADAKLIGSATLLEEEEQLFALTAMHVADRLAHSKKIGLITQRYTERETIREDDPGENYPIDVSHIEILRPCTTGRFCDAGLPDVALVKLPDYFRGHILASKSALPVDRLIEDAKSCEAIWLKRMIQQGVKRGIFCLAGAIGEYAEHTYNPTRKHHTYLFGGLASVGTLTGTSEKDGYDLLEFSLLRKSGDSLPDSFGGHSGGGVWFFPTQISDEVVSVRLSQLKLIGLTFYEQRESGKANRIWAMGPRSLVRVLKRLLGDLKS